MAFFKKLFGKKEKAPEPAPLPVQEKYTFSWIAAADNQWNLPLLDMRKYASEMLSFTTDEKLARNAASYGGDDGTSFIGKQPENKQFITTDIRLPTVGLLPYGALFLPNTMEHKWAIFFHEDEIIFVRSWAREVYVTAQTVREPDSLRIKSITGSFTGEEHADDTIAILRFLLLTHSQHGSSPAPMPPELAESPEAAAQWGFSAFGSFSQLGVFSAYQAPVKEPLRTYSLLHIAVAKGNTEGIQQQLELGTDINYLAADGLSPLQWAQNAETSQLLLSVGADPHVRSAHGATALMIAAQGKKDIVLLLLDAGADVNAIDDRGFTALHRAAEKGHTDIVKLLLEHGADKHIAAGEHTATSLAKMQDRKEILQLLAEAP